MDELGIDESSGIHRRKLSEEACKSRKTCGKHHTAHQYGPRQCGGMLAPSVQVILKPSLVRKDGSKVMLCKCCKPFLVDSLGVTTCSY